jgi:hypothetical protein
MGAAYIIFRLFCGAAPFLIYIKDFVCRAYIQSA